MTTPAVRVDHLSKRFVLQQERRYSFKERVVRGRPKGVREFWALKDISFEVPRGSFFGIVGHNGSGKSTALKVLSGIYRPTSGTVEVNGRLRAMLELGAGFHPELTGRENIKMNASILGMSSKEIRSSMDDIIEFAGIGEFIDAPVKVYSSGMTVRLGFSVAVNMDPEILIVDEVIAVGDEEFQRRCLDHLFKLRRQGTTIVLVTHSMGVVEDMCDEAMWLDHGTIRALGGTRDVVTQYMSQVNETEAARKSEDSPPASELDAVRRGSGGARVTAFEVTSDLGDPLEVLLAGRSCRFRLHVATPVALVDATVSFTVHTEAGVPVAGPLRYDGPQGLPAGNSQVDFRMDTQLLQPGTYVVSTTITAGGELLDFLDKPFVLKVRDSGAENSPGAVRLLGEWSVSRESTAADLESTPPDVRPGPATLSG